MDVVSVIIPVRDGEAHIGEAVKSALAQGPSVAQVVVVDDGSRDGTAALLATMSDPRLLVLDGGGNGVSHARNLGFSHVTSPWAMFLDADDRLRPDAVARLIDAGIPAGTVAVYGDYERIDAAGRRTGRRGLLRSRRAKPSGRILENLLAGNFIVNGGVMLIRREAFAAIGGFDERLRYCEDWHAWCRLAARGDILFRQGTHVLDYRVHASSTMMGGPHNLADYLPALDAIFTDPAIRHAVPAERLAALKARAQTHLEAYLIGQAVRSRRYGDVASGLWRTLVKNPSRLPRTLAMCGGALAGI